MIARRIFSIVYIIIISFVTISCRSIQQKERKLPFNWVDTVLANISGSKVTSASFNVLQFGAIADGQTDNKSVIDRAIKACENSGGGKVIFPPGKYLVKGPIHMISNLELRIEAGAELIFGGDSSCYLPVVKSRWEGTILYNYSPFIYAYKKHNISITGKGIINGNSKDTWNKWINRQRQDLLLARKMNNEGVPIEKRIFGGGHSLRTSLIEFYECESVLMDGITIINAPFWCVHPVFSKNIIIRNLLFSAHNNNNDGIDPDSSEDVLIENITFDNADDNIAIKSGRDREGRELNIPSKNIVVRNCHFKGHNAFSIGSEISGGVYNVLVENCSYAGKVRSGFYLKSNNDRGGSIAHIYARNLTFDTCEYAIEMDTDYKHEGKGHPSEFYDIRIENITAKNATVCGISLVGSEEKPIHNVHLNNVTINKATKFYMVEQVKAIHLKNVVIEGAKVNKFK